MIKIDLFLIEIYYVKFEMKILYTGVQFGL